MGSKPLRQAIGLDQPKNRSKLQTSEREAKFLKNKEWKQRLRMQRWVPGLITFLVISWLVFIGIIVILDGTETLEYHPSVLVSLISSATVSIVALLMKVVSYTLPEMKW